MREESMNKGLNRLAAMSLAETIRLYYTRRGLKWPTAQEAVLWALSELGEATDLLLMQESGWTRNHPEEHPGFDPDKFSEELGDTIMMLVVAGLMAKGAKNPLRTLALKIERWLQQDQT